MLTKKKENKTQTYIVVGPYRIAVPRDAFIAWEKALMIEAGFTDKEIKAEILRRLGYEQN